MNKLKNFADLGFYVDPDEGKERQNIMDLGDDYLAALVAKDKKKTEFKCRPFEFFYEDVIEKPLNHDFKKSLGEETYEAAKGDAESSLNVWLEFHTPEVTTVFNWQQSAINFCCEILKHYVQSVLRENLIQYGDAKKEKSLFIQVSKIQDDIKEAGNCLIAIQDSQNKDKHRLKSGRDGKSYMRRPDKWWALEITRQNFPIALQRILEAYKSRFPQGVPQSGTKQQTANAKQWR